VTNPHIPNPASDQIVVDEALPGAQSLTLLRKSAERRRKREAHLFLDVPSWDGDLVAEYRVLPPDQLKAMIVRMASKVQKGIQNQNGTQIGDGDIQLIASACVGLSIRDPESGDRVEITDEFGRVGFDRIGTFLQAPDEIQGQAEMIKYVMSEKEEDGTWTPNVIAIGIHANAVAKWMQDPSKRTVDMEGVLGEL
jgi:hypothetical protein